MRTWVFIFDQEELVMDRTATLETAPALSVQAASYEDALAALAAAWGCGLHGSDDPEDYRRDVDEGNISVVLPVQLG